MLQLQVITASTRDGRKGPLVADWFMRQASAHGRFEVELVDLAEVELPLFDEPKHPRLREYVHEHTRRWSRIVERADAYVVVTPEYDHGPPASLLNALQYLVLEWAYKPMAFVSYGGVSAGTRSVAMLKPVAAALKLVPLMESVSIPFFAKFIGEDGREFVPGSVQDDAARVMLDELVRWAEALRPMRAHD